MIFKKVDRVTLKCGKAFYFDVKTDIIKKKCR